MVRDKAIEGGASVESLEPFRVGETLYGAFLHNGPNGEEHKGNMKVVEITDTLRFKAEAVCVQPDCGVRVEVEGVPQ